MKMGKRMIVTALSMAFAAGGAMTAHAAGWVPEGSVWKYQNEDGTYASGGWYWIDGNSDGNAECYYFDAAGNLSVSTVIEGYTVDANGAWVQDNIVQIKQTGTNPVTSSSTGWYPVADGRWRYRTNGTDIVGQWRTISNKRYYFDDEGYMATGFYHIDGDEYYFQADGSLQKKTFLLDGVYYVIPESDGVITDEVDEFDWSDYKKENDIGSSDSKGSGSSSSGRKGSGGSSSSGSSSYGGSYSLDDADESEYAERVFELVNEEREAAGKDPLEWDESLAECARIRAEELTEKFSHTRPDGTLCFSILDEKNIRGSAWGENIAMGQRTPEAVMDGWMHSDGHKANILKDKFTQIGVGCYIENGTAHWVQMFNRN